MFTLADIDVCNGFNAGKGVGGIEAPRKAGANA